MTNAELAILSLLAEQARHGYALEETITARGMREWTEIGFSSIYYLLTKLQRAGLVETASQAANVGNKARKVYRLTPAGYDACAASTREALAHPHPSYPSILLGLANLPLLPPGEAKAALATRADLLARRLDEVERQQARQAPLPLHVDAIFRYSIAQLNAELGWLQDTIKETEKDMGKIDFRKSMKALYQPSAKDFTLVDVPPMRYLMIDGRGNPNTSQTHQDAVETLYAVAYALKFASKSTVGKDYVVAPLEGLWWADDMRSFTSADKDAWQWTMMIMQPEWVTVELIEKTLATVRIKKSLPALDLLRHEILTEGHAVQIMHIGPYDEEGPTLARLHQDYLPQKGLEPNGKHHEIYLSDPRKTEPAKLKTVLRQPVRACKS